MAAKDTISGDRICESDYQVLLGAYARRRRPQWTEHLTKRRLAVLGILTLAVSGIKLIEDVVAKESGPVDAAILWFVRDPVRAALTGFFAVVTFSGSARFLVPLAAMTAVVLLVARRRFESVLLGASVITATLVVWGMKAIVGRARPALWEAQWYRGSSFPSGHTLSTAAFATAAALCVACIWPRAGSVAMALAVLWTGLIGTSRLLLGMHWPSDVLAAICLGAFIPLLISVAKDLRRRSSDVHFQWAPLRLCPLSNPSSGTRRLNNAPTAHDAVLRRQGTADEHENRRAFGCHAERTTARLGAVTISRSGGRRPIAA